MAKDVGGRLLKKLVNQKHPNQRLQAWQQFSLHGMDTFLCVQCDVVLRHTLPVFTGLGRCPIVNWDFAGAVSIFGPDALPVVHQ